MRTIVTALLASMIVANAFSQRLEDKEINVVDLGVIPNDPADQSQIINKLLLKPEYDGINFFFPAGVYIVRSLIIYRKVTLSGQQGSVLRGLACAPGDVTPIIDIRGGSKIRLKDLTIEGQNLRSVGIYVYTERTQTPQDTIEIDNCIIKGFNNVKGPAYGIQVHTDRGMVNILNSRIIGVRGFDDGIIGNPIGANRGIYINNVNTVLVRNCWLQDIEGYEDGDCIHYYRWDEDNLKPATTGKVTIENNIFYNVYKRGIKIQATNAIVKNNQFYDHKEDNKPSYAAISIYKDNNLIENNTIEMNQTQYGIEVDNSGGNMIIANDINIRRPYAQDWLIQPIIIINVHGVRIYGNTIRNEAVSNIVQKKGTNYFVSSQ